MVKLVVDNFGGEIPRMDPRALPPGAAQVSKNLLASATEFRPLQQDQSVTTATTNAKSLYRFNRKSDGTFHTIDSEGWTTSTDDLNFVRGAVNDDALERSFVSNNLGTDYPKMVDITGASRRLGVPTPTTAPACTLNAVSQFTSGDANAWLTGTLTTAIVDAIKANLDEDNFTARWDATNSKAVAGASSTYGLSATTYPTSQRGFTEPWSLVVAVPETTALSVGLDAPNLSGVVVGSDRWMGIVGLPLWGRITNATTFKAALAAITNPKTSAQLWTSGEIDSIAADLMDWFDPDNAELAVLRGRLDDAILAFSTGLGVVLHSVPSAPTPPTKPSVAQYDYDAYTGSATENALWTTYNADLATYNANLAAYNAAVADQSAQKAARVGVMVDAMASASAGVKAIENAYTSLKASLADKVTSYLRDLNLIQSQSNTTGKLSVDPDRIIDTRFYAYTYVTDLAEESAPSPISDVIEADQNDTVTIAAPSVPSGRHITAWRLYRTNTGTTTTTFEFVDEIAAGSPYTDSKLTAELGEPCPTTTWAEPSMRVNSDGSAKGSDPYLRGLVSMANGVLAGFIDNYVAFCDPYHPYAWPVEYQIPLRYEIVGIAAFGSTLFVGTTGKPSIISGSDSASMSEIQLDESQSCASRRSIIATQGGALYASPDGLCLANLSGVQVLTTGLFSREDWQALDPTSIVAFTHDNIYYFSYTGNGGGAYAVDFASKKLVRVDTQFTAVWDDLVSDGLFFVNGSNIYRLQSTGRCTGQWRSGKIEVGQQQPMAWAKVMGEQSGGSPVTLKWYGDGVLRYTTTITDTNPVRLPYGRYLEHEVEILSTARVTKVVLAGSTQELVS